MIELVSFWTGRLTWIERLCLASMLRQGHRVSVYSYGGNIEGIASHPMLEQREAADILPLTDDLRRMGKKQPAFLADMLRFELMAAKDCAWVDLDLLLLKPFGAGSPEAPLFMAFETSDRHIINTAALRLPSDSDLLADIRTFCGKRPVLAPWWTGKRLWKHKAWIALGAPIQPEDSQWGIFGPKLITYLVQQKGLGTSVSAHTTVYPVPFAQCAALIEPAAVIEDWFASDTFAVHLWAHRLRKLTPDATRPPAGSWLAQRIHEHCID
jgi:hypothetical protein